MDAKELIVAGGNGSISFQCHKYTLANEVMCNDIIYQPLRSGRIWHKVSF